MPKRSKKSRSSTRNKSRGRGSADKPRQIPPDAIPDYVLWFQHAGEQGYVDRDEDQGKGDYIAIFDVLSADKTMFPHLKDARTVALIYHY